MADGNAWSVRDLNTLTDAVGFDAALRLTRPLSPEDECLVDAVLAVHGGDPVAALGMHHLPEETKAEIRRVMAEVTA